MKKSMQGIEQRTCGRGTATAIAQGNIINSGTGLKGDWLAGGAGSDTLVGSAGNDVLSGGGGIERRTRGRDTNRQDAVFAAVTLDRLRSDGCDLQAATLKPALAALPDGAANEARYEGERRAA